MRFTPFTPSRTTLFTLTHAKDGIQIHKCNPEVVYHVVPMPEELAADNGRPFKEVPLGTGSVDFPKYLAALEEVGFKGFLTIEREVGENPSADIKTAYTFLKGIING